MLWSNEFSHKLFLCNIYFFMLNITKQNFWIKLELQLRKNLITWMNLDTAWKVSLFGVFLVRIFPHSDWILRDTEYFFVFSPNAGKYGPEKFRIRTLFTQWEAVVRRYSVKKLLCNIHRKTSVQWPRHLQH